MAKTNTNNSISCISWVNNANKYEELDFFSLFLQNGASCLTNETADAAGFSVPLSGLAYHQVIGVHYLSRDQFFLTTYFTGGMRDGPDPNHKWKKIKTKATPSGVVFVVMGCTSSLPDEPETNSRTRGYSTVDNKQSGSSGDFEDPSQALDDRETAIEANLEFNHETMSITAAWVSRRGYYPENPDKDNQDSYSFQSRLGVRPPGRSQSFFAVYDGHGKDGHHVAQHCRDNLPDMILNEITERVLLQDGSNALIRGVVHMAKKLSGSFISLGKHDTATLV